MLRIQHNGYNKAVHEPLHISDMSITFSYLIIYLHLDYYINWYQSRGFVACSKTKLASSTYEVIIIQKHNYDTTSVLNTNHYLCAVKLP